MFNTDEQINAVDRRVGTRLLDDQQEAATVSISQTLAADIADVWDGCTNAERIPRWFLPISGQLRQGGQFQLEGNASGTIEQCDPPEGFDTTWEFGGRVSWLELRLDAVDDGQTRLQLTHIVPIDDHWKQYGPGATGVGWDGAVSGLAMHLQSGEPVDQHKAKEWMASEEGQQFYVRCSELWGEAHIAAGADEVQARQAAERTAGFYTGS